METVAGHPRWWFNDFADEVYEEAEDERTREALSILNDVHVHYMSDYEDIVENAQSEAQLLVRMTEFSQRLASEVGVSEEATAPATRRDMRIAGVANRGSAGGKDLDL